jgi:hypothetical protein
MARVLDQRWNGIRGLPDFGHRVELRSGQMTRLARDVTSERNFRWEPHVQQQSSVGLI